MILLSILFSNIIFINVEVVKAYDAPSITTWGEQLLSNDCSKNRFPGITRTMNGTLVVVYDCSDADDDPRTYKYMRSFDNGVTWTSPTIIFSFTDSQYDGHWALKTAPNGDVLFAPVYKADAAGSGNWSTRFIRSQDNGSTWEDWYWMDESVDNDGSNQYLIYDWILYEKKIYGFTQDSKINDDAYIIVSEDNGTTWSKFGNEIVNTDSDEWYAIPLYGNGTWRTIHRDDQGWDNNYITYNNGSTWTSTGEDLPMNGQNRGVSMLWLDDEVILSISEGDLIGDSCYIHETHDNMTSWSLVSTLGVGSGNNYGRGVSLPKRAGNVGGWAYVVYGKGNTLYGKWIANNATQLWTWPPGPDDSDEEFYTATSSSTSDPHFIDINEQSNNTQITSSSIWGNSTKYLSSDYGGSETFLKVTGYQIRIANDSAFTDVFANVTGINSTYAGTYSDNATHFYFKLASTVEGYGGDIGDHYYQVRPRIRVRTT